MFPKSFDSSSKQWTYGVMGHHLTSFSVFVLSSLGQGKGR